MFTGRTHLPFDLTGAGRREVNPGSVGQPEHGAPETCYATWDNGALVLRRRTYPFDETTRKIRALPIAVDIRERLVEGFLEGRPPGRRRV